MVVIHNPLEVKVEKKKREPLSKGIKPEKEASTSAAAHIFGFFNCCFLFLYCAPHSGASHSSVSVPPASTAAACQATDDDAEEGDDAVNDCGEHVADAADDGHDDGADGPEDGFELQEELVSIWISCSNMDR
jgi:hypothetical protein